ncbi:MAG: metallophosphoesterase [Kiritimatiellae bacterium]|nr:metallophosphoesterase [Kiritimatiellia bacterium]
MAKARSELSRRSFLALAAAGVAGCVSKRGADCGPGFDENLSVIFSDAHVCGEKARAASFTPKRLASFVDEVLAMRPMPRRVIHLGDLAYLHGHPADYAVSKPMLKRLEDAGVELVFCMGNHDRRSEFAKAWPGRLEKSPVPGKFVSVTSLGTADLVILDGLQGADDRPLTDMGPGQGMLTPDQFEWLKGDFPKRTRPFFVASHFPVEELKTSEKKPVHLGRWLIKNAPMCAGYVYGHLHRWRPEWIHGSWGGRKTMRTLCMPSNGLWGDIGYATFRTYPDRAVCSLELKDCFFPGEPDDPNDRPAPWRLKVEETRGGTCTFLYDRKGG